jgi:predicted GIY-YIG superfamily endonuclease
MNNQKTALYRHFGKNNELLYIGISYNPFARLSQHELSASWASLTAKMTIEYFESRDDAIEAEKLAIINEKPIYNVIHNECSENEFSSLDERIIFNRCIDEILIEINKMIDGRTANYPVQGVESSTEYVIRAIKNLLNSDDNLPLLKAGINGFMFNAPERIDLDKSLDELVAGVCIVLDSVAERDSKEYDEIIDSIAIDEYTSHFSIENESDFSFERFDIVKEAVRKRNRTKLDYIVNASLYNNVLSALRGGIGLSLAMNKAMA